MEKITFKNSRNLNINGLFHPVDSDSVIILCHGLGGDNSEWGRFEPTATKFNEAGYNVLRFDFGGCGESYKAPLILENHLDDYKSAISYLENKGFKKIIVLGLSFGGLIATKANDSRVQALILWAPMTNPKNYRWEERFSTSELKELKYDEWIEIQQEKMLTKTNVPTLIIQGDSDRIIQKDDTLKAAELIKDSTLYMIENDTHDLKELDIFIDKTIAWLKITNYL
jgi:pimeloyl-ACP methyl ester carboxylesterase